MALQFHAGETPVPTGVGTTVSSVGTKLKRRLSSSQILGDKFATGTDDRSTNEKRADTSVRP